MSSLKSCVVSRGGGVGVVRMSKEGLAKKVEKV